MDSLTMLENQVHNLHVELSDHMESEAMRDADTAAKMAILSDKVDKLLANTENILSLWEQARGMLTLIKWLAAIGGSLASVYVFFKGK